MRARAGQWVARYRYHVAAGAVAAGLALSTASAEAAAGAGLVVGIVLVTVHRAGFAVVCALLVAAGAGVGELRLEAIDRAGARLAPFSAVDERAVLLERPRGPGTRMRAAVRLLSGRARGAKLLAVEEGPWQGPVEPGTEVRVRGTAKPPRRAEGGRFDWPAHLRRHGIAHELELARIAATGAKRGGIAGAVDRARRRAESAIEAGLPRGRAALARGMVLGQDEAIDPLTRDDWRDAGLAHLLSYAA